MRNRYHGGPVSDHFNGEQFFIPGHSWTPSFTKLLKWRFAGGGAKWPEFYPSPYSDTPPERVTGKELRVSFVGHASFLYQTAGMNILVDPIWSERASPFDSIGPKRVNPPGIRFGDLPPVDAVLVTHNHYDHLDLNTLSRLWETHRPRIITPPGNEKILQRSVPGPHVEIADWGARIELGPDIVLHSEPALHWSARGIFDRCHALWASFAIETPGGTVLHVGDTGFGDGNLYRELAEKHPRIRLAVLPMGSYEPRWFMRSQHVNPDEAVRIFRILGAEKAIGHHWGTFPLSDEGIEQPLVELAQARIRHGVREEDFHPMRPGEVWKG